MVQTSELCYIQKSQAKTLAKFRVSNSNAFESYCQWCSAFPCFPVLLKERRLWVGINLHDKFAFVNIRRQWKTVPFWQSALSVPGVLSIKGSRNVIFFYTLIQLHFFNSNLAIFFFKFLALKKSIYFQCSIMPIAFGLYGLVTREFCWKIKKDIFWEVLDPEKS